MNIRNRRELKQIAADIVANGRGNPRRLVLAHYLVAAAATVLLTVLNYYLSEEIGQTGGLSGLGTRSVLTTVRSVVQMAVTVLLPFWEMGLVFVSMRFARREYTDYGDLPQGFFRFFPVLRFLLLQILVYTVAAFAAMYTAWFVYILTPWSGDFLQAVEQVLAGQQVDALQVMEQVDAQAIIPFMVIFMALFLGLSVFLSYRLRMAQYLVMDEQRSVGAFRAIFMSIRKMRGNAWALARLDISFWWFYLLRALFGAVGSLDLLLSAVGITLPISADGAYFLFYGIAVIMQILLYWKAGAYLQTAYALAYDAVIPPEDDQTP